MIVRLAETDLEVVAELNPQAIEVLEIEQTLNGRPQQRQIQLRIATNTTHLSVLVMNPGRTARRPHSGRALV